MNFKSKKFIAIALVLLVVIALVLVLVSTPPTEWTKAQQLGDFIQSQGVLGVLVFLVACAAATAVGLPRQFFAFSSGFAYGVVGGVALSSSGAILGCAITFFFSRHWFSAWVKARYPEAIKGLNSLLEDDVFLKVLALRLQPLGTNFVTNVSAGVTNVSARQFLLSSWLGYIPQMLVFSLLGTGVRLGSNAYVMFSLAMLVVSLGIGLWLYKRAMRTQ